VLTPAPGDGTATATVLRSSKRWDPENPATLSHFGAAGGKGTAPYGCHLVTYWGSRLVFADKANWYMSRCDDYGDWDYSKEDEGAAVSGATAIGGQTPESITALLPLTDDLLLFGCRNSLWLMRGNPTLGGSLDLVARGVGVLSGGACCLVPSGAVVFVAYRGLWAWRPGGQLISISGSRCPQEFQALSEDDEAEVVYDRDLDLVHVWLHGRTPGPRRHFLVAPEVWSMWPATVAAVDEPCVACQAPDDVPAGPGVLVGSRDGYVRAFDREWGRDEAGQFTSYAVIGPIRPGGNQMGDGLVRDLTGVLDEYSGNVAWSLLAGATEQAALSASAAETGTFTAGRNRPIYARRRAGAFALKLAGATDRRWAVESVEAVLVPGGKQRMPG